MYKILSYLLICTGLFIIFFAVHGMYSVFIGGGSAPGIVNFADLAIQTQVGSMLLPMQQANLIINLGLFTLFMGFLVMVGSKVAGVGCQILKNERIYHALRQLQLQGGTLSQGLKQL